MLLAHRAELLRGLRRNHIVMSMKVKSRASSPVTGKKTNGNILILLLPSPLESLAL